MPTPTAPRRRQGRGAPRGLEILAARATAPEATVDGTGVVRWRGEQVGRPEGQRRCRGGALRSPRLHQGQVDGWFELEGTYRWVPGVVGVPGQGALRLLHALNWDLTDLGDPGRRPQRGVRRRRSRPLRAGGGHRLGRGDVAAGRAAPAASAASSCSCRSPGSTPSASSPTRGSRSATSRRRFGGCWSIASTRPTGVTAAARPSSRRARRRPGRPAALRPAPPA